MSKKVAESKRKDKKASKKDVTWKSNKPKDLGIPNSFPYKDQLLAEMAAEKQKVRSLPPFVFSRSTRRAVHNLLWTLTSSLALFCRPKKKRQLVKKPPATVPPL